MAVTPTQAPATAAGPEIKDPTLTQQLMLDALSGPWQDAWETSDPGLAALLLRLFGTHLQVHSDRIMKAMILERLDQEIQTLGIV